MVEPWTDAELLVRLFRLLQSPAGSGSASRTEPLVLLADDDPELTELVEHTLQRDGIACQSADSGLTVLRMARELVPDLIVLDVKMPGMNGFDVLKTIRGDPRLQAILVVLLTSCNDPDDVARASELRADQYVTKPVNPNLLLNRIKRLLATHTGGNRRWAQSVLSGTSNERTARKWIPGKPADGADVIQP